MKEKLILVIIASGVLLGSVQSSSPVHAEAQYVGQKLSVVLLGDSYSAGNGADGTEYGPAGCHRNTNTWAEQYKEWLRSLGLAVTFQNRACSGAKTGDLLENQKRVAHKVVRLADWRVDASAVEEYIAKNDVCVVRTTDEVRDASQRIVSIERMPGVGANVSVECAFVMKSPVDGVDKSTDLVLLTIGGNDLGFDSIIRECFAKVVRVASFLSSCKNKIENAVEELPDMVERTWKILDALRTRLRPDAKIVLAGYPLLALDNNVAHFGYPIAQEVRKLGIEGNRRQKEMVAAYNRTNGGEQIVFVDAINSYFAGHEPDAAADRKNPNRWVHEFFEPSIIDMSGWYHPNPLGHSAYALKVREAVPLSTIMQPIVQAKSDIDIVFVVDTTGSMYPHVQLMKDTITTIIQSIEDRARSARFALVTYQDHPEYSGSASDYPARVEIGFSEDRDAVVAVVNKVHTGDGGDLEEAVYSGIQTGLDLPWRAGVKKIVIVLGDAPAKDPEPVTGLTEQDIIDRAYAVDPAQIYTVDMGHNETTGLRGLSEATGGALYSRAEGTVDELILRSVESISQKPHAWLNGPYVAKVGDTIELDASGSYSANGAIVKYEWDLNADGSYDLVTTQAVLLHKTNTEVSGLMAVRVTDTSGQVNIANTFLTVSDDGDEIPRAFDNCPDVANQSQNDYDQDGLGDSCDEDPGFLEEYGYYESIGRRTLSTDGTIGDEKEGGSRRSVVSMDGRGDFGVEADTATSNAKTETVVGRRGVQEVVEGAQLQRTNWLAWVVVGSAGLISGVGGFWYWRKHRQTG